MVWSVTLWRNAIGGAALNGGVCPMPYQAEISRTNPTAFLFLIDQSGSMEDPWAGSDGGASKADALATIINRLFTETVIKCSKDEGVRNYFDIGVLAYGNDVRPALGGPLAGRIFVPVGEIADNPARVEDRVQKVSDGAGGLVDQTVTFPVWFEPHAKGGTPMTEALKQAREAVDGWIQTHPDAFPPIVFNITDGEATDGDPSHAAASLRDLATSDGGALLFNIHLSGHRGKVEFPDSEQGLADDYAKRLFLMSSVLPPYLQREAQAEGYAVVEGARGFVFNADLAAVIQFLDIGTRPANLR
jgi:hypothetical protein